MNFLFLLLIYFMLTVFGFIVVSMVAFWKRKIIKAWLFERVSWTKDRYFKLYFVEANGQMSWLPALIQDDEHFHENGKRYKYDSECVKFEGKKATLYYYKNDVFPINFNKTNRKNFDVEIDASTYQKVMAAKIIRDLLDDRQQMMIIMIILGVIAVAVVVLVVYQMGFLDQFLGPQVAK